MITDCYLEHLTKTTRLNLNVIQINSKYIESVFVMQDVQIYNAIFKICSIVEKVINHGSNCNSLLSLFTNTKKSIVNNTQESLYNTALQHGF